MGESWRTERLAADIAERWRSRGTADARTVLEEHPALNRRKSLVLALAYEEYCQRLETAEHINTLDFCRRFPECATSLRRRIEIHQLLDENPQFLGEPPAWPQPGHSFLRFHLLETLGQGAMGRVYLAEERTLSNRLVVVKISPAGNREAQTLSKLEHPNIVPIHSIEEDKQTGLIAICMPFVSRFTLEDFLDHLSVMGGRSRRFGDVLRHFHENSPKELVPGEANARSRFMNASYIDGVIDVGRQIAEALAYAHAKGICHLDLKPSNILLTSAGKATLIDFNLSLDGSASSHTMGGTLPYMSPEQIQWFFRLGEARHVPIDHRSDIYSLGVILVELLTGSHPFGPISWKRGATQIVEELLRRQREHEASLVKLSQQVDAGLARLVRSCLAFDPDRRLQTASDLAGALQKRLARLARARRWSKAHRRSVVALGTLLLGASLTVAYVWAIRPSFAERQLSRGWELYRQGQFEAATENFALAIKAAPNPAPALFARARALQQQGNFLGAFQDFRDAQLIHPERNNLVGMGYTVGKSNDHRTAIYWYQRAVQEGSRSAELFSAIGYSYQKLSWFDEAERWYGQAIEVNPRLQAAWHNRAYNEYVKCSRTQTSVSDRAVSDIKEAIDIGPLTWDLLHNAARVAYLSQIDEPERSQLVLKYLKHAVELGLDPQQHAVRPEFPLLHGNTQFEEIMRTSPPTVPGPRAVRLVDPLTE
jgi:tetratricopeptide (TPR) repeat protein